MGSSENTDWVFDYGLIENIPVPGGDLPSLDPPAFTWPSHTFRTDFDDDDSPPRQDDPKETGSRKRMSSGSCEFSSKARREKIRRDRLNDRFLELNSILNHGRTSKIDKSAILGDAVRMIKQLKDEAQKLKECNKNFQEKINETKAEKNELRDEKQKLKEAKDKLKQKMKASSTEQGFLSHTMAATSHVIGGKLVPLMGYPGLCMWQFMPPGAIDTSQDHVLHPPVA